MKTLPGQRNSAALGDNQQVLGRCQECPQHSDQCADRRARATDEKCSA
jgi:hypothetical protein